MTELMYSRDLDISLIPNSKNLSYYCILIPYSYSTFSVHLHKVLNDIVEKDKEFNTYIDATSKCLLLKINNINKFDNIFEDFITKLKSTNHYLGHYLHTDNSCIVKLKITNHYFDNFIEGNYSKILDQNNKGFWIKPFYDKFNKHPIIYSLTKSKKYFVNHIMPYYGLMYDETKDEEVFNSELYLKEFINKPVLEKELL